MTVTIPQAWKLFWRARKLSRFGSLSEAAEWMYRLNVFARSIGRHTITDQIYELKNELIKYLYQHGYCTEAKLHVQEFPCWGPLYGECDDDCPRCGGTGVYRSVKLYAFRFEIGGRRYAWHQPEKLIDYPITLTTEQPGEYVEPKRDQAILSMEEAWLGSCVVWWVLLWRGLVTELLLFDATRHLLVSLFRGMVQKFRWTRRSDD